jgi:hypothetical protein
MIQKIKTTLLTTLAAVSLLVVPVMATGPSVYADDIADCVSQGSGLNGTIDGTCSPDTSALDGNNGDLTDTFKFIINVFSVIVGVIAVIMIIWGGLKYITSGGDSGKVTSAKNTIIYAIIGLIIVALAQFIIQFVLKKASDAI